MNTRILQVSDAAAFLKGLESVPWFQNIGKPLPANASVRRLERWDEWPGPEESGVFELFERQQKLYDEVLAESASNRDEVDRCWEQTQQIVIQLASTAIPFDPEQDPWHAPSAAVRQAAWTAGLMGLCILLFRPIPPELQEQWNWFSLGRWPAGYSIVRADDRLGPLLVY